MGTGIQTHAARMQMRATMLILPLAPFLVGLFLTFRNPDNGRSTFGPDQYIGISLCGIGLIGWLCL